VERGYAVRFSLAQNLRLPEPGEQKGDEPIDL
jgi:hypothetical protein